MNSFFSRLSAAMATSIALFVSPSSFAEDCAGPAVKLGEVMAGFQAGLTGGAHTATGMPGGYFVSAGGEDRRGFIVPEAVTVSQQCENDYILISGWQGCGLRDKGNENGRKPKEAKDCAVDLNGHVVDRYFEIDGVKTEHMQTTAKIGINPFNGVTNIAAITTGIVIEPYSLPVGAHTAVVVYSWDDDLNGVADFDLVLFNDFTINPAP
jgi:hypothetical protein